MKLTEKDSQDMEAAYRETIRFTHPEYWTTSVEIFKGLLEKYPDATDIKTIPALRKDGSVTLIHHPLDANGEVCGPGEDDSNPCPPYC